MLSDKMLKALNDQINAEGYSAYLYLAMAAYCESENLPGFGNWMRIQAQEELVHMMKFYSFINARGGRVSLGAVKAPQKAWKSPIDVFDGVLKHEQHVTELINNLVDIALSERDHATNSFLQWFVTEQVEEMATADEILKQLKLLGGTGQGLFMIDRDLATRVFTMPPGGLTSATV